MVALSGLAAADCLSGDLGLLSGDLGLAAPPVT
jgi:hypothetical protein